MRTTQLTIIVLLVPALLAAALPAGANGKRIVEPSCEVIPPNCAAPQPNCAKPAPNCAQPESNCPPKNPCPPPSEAPPQAMLAPQPMGAFVQPPATGEVRGPVYSTEVQGATITFPELRLRMPSIRMPSLAKYRSDSRMEMAPANAPYVQQPVAAPMMAAAPYAAPMAAAPMMAAPYAAPYAPPYATPLMAPPYYAPPAAPPQQPPAAPPSAPPAAPYRAPDCAAVNNAAAALDPLEEKLRRIEAAERRLQAQVEELHRCLKQLPANGQNAPAGEPLKSSRIPLRPIGPVGHSGNEDNSLPASPPQPPPDLGRQPRFAPAPTGTPYPAQPAAHYQAAPTASQVIREPGQPRALITGVR